MCLGMLTEVHMQELCPMEKTQQETEEGAVKVVCDVFPLVHPPDVFI